jgi:hypothetical protein
MVRLSLDLVKGGAATLNLGDDVGDLRFPDDGSGRRSNACPQG